MAIANKYKGDTVLDIGGKKYTLRYDWNAIGMLVTELGKGFEQKIIDAALEMDMPVLAKALAIGLERHHAGELTDKDIARISPPIVAVFDAVNRAISLAFYGKAEAPADENPTIPERLLRLAKILSGRHSRTPPASA